MISMNNYTVEECLTRLNIPLDVYETLGVEALSYTEKEMVRICLQLASRRPVSYDKSAFDAETEERIKEVIGDDDC